MCGASSEQKETYAAQSDFYKQLTAAYKESFAKNQGVLDLIVGSLKPTLQAGINQEGFSGAEKTNLNAQATTGTGANYQKASEALAEAQGTQGGGTSYIPTGAKEQQQRQLATSAAETESILQSNITAADYATGRQNYLEAAGILGGAAAQYNPTGYANAATGAGSAAADSANSIASANNSWMGLVSGALGAAGTAAGGYFSKH